MGIELTPEEQDSITWAYNWARKNGLEREFDEEYVWHRRHGYSVRESIDHALWEWDL